MDVRRKFSSLCLVAALLATAGMALTAGGVAASVTVGSAGTVPAGGESSGLVSFTFVENGPAAFPAGGGTLSVSLADALGVPTVHFVGQPSIAADSTLGGVSLSMAPTLSGFTLTIGSTSTAATEQVVIGGVKLSTDSVAAPGAIMATLGGTLASAVSATTTLASPGTVTGGSTATHLQFTTQPGGGASGAAWAQQPVVAVWNAANNVVTSDNTTVVTLSIGTNPGGGVLSCTNGNSRTVVNGFAAFTGCQITGGSTSPYTLTATATGGAASATSAQFTITGAGGNHLTFISQPGGGAVGTAFAQQPSVAVQNASNVTNTTDNTTVVTLSLGTNPGGGTLTCTGGNSRTVVAGVAAFSGCSVSAGSASPYTIVATANSGATSATSTGFVITTARTAVTLTSDTAVGNTTSGFSTSTKIVSKGTPITLRIVTSPSLAGQSLSIWIAKKTGTVWGAFSPHASVTVGSDGIAYYVYSAGSLAYLSFQAKFAGSATVAPALAPARQARWK